MYFYLVSDTNVLTCFDAIKEMKANSPHVITTRKGEEKAASQQQSNGTKRPMDVSGKYHIHSAIDDFVLLRTGITSSAKPGFPPSK